MTAGAALRRPGILRSTDLRLHHKSVLEVQDLATVKGFTLLHAQNSVSALQLVRFFAAAEVVDEEAELLNMLKALCHYHLLVDQVGLGQVGSSLDVDQQLQEVSGRHHDGGVEWDDVAFV